MCVLSNKYFFLFFFSKYYRKRSNLYKKIFFGSFCEIFNMFWLSQSLRFFFQIYGLFDPIFFGANAQNFSKKNRSREAVINQNKSGNNIFSQLRVQTKQSGPAGSS